MCLENGETERAAELIQLPCSVPAGTATQPQPVNIGGEYRFEEFILTS